MMRRKRIVVPRKPEFDEQGAPKCWGTFIKGRECDCPHRVACREYTFDKRGERKSDRRWEHRTMPLLDGMDIPNEKAALAQLRTMFKIPNTEIEFDPADLNMNLIVFFSWFAIEYPATVKALLIRLMPNVRNLQDIADLMGVTRQAVQKRVKAELGMEKRNYKVEEFMKLRGIELDVYRLCIKDGCSRRSAAKQLGISEGTVRNKLKSLERKGFKYENDGEEED